MDVLLSLGSAELHVVVLGTMLAVGCVLGAAMAHSDYCAFGAIADWVNFGDRGRLGGWLWAIATAVAGAGLLGHAGILDIKQSLIPYAASTFNPVRLALGGLLFGFGMHLTGGCTSKNLVRLGGGSLKSFVVLLCAALPSYLLIRTTTYEQWFYPLFQPFTVALDELGYADQTVVTIGSRLLPTDSQYLPILLPITLALIVSGYSLTLIRASARRRSLFGGTVVGLAVIAGWWVSAGPLGRQWLENASFEWQPPPGIGVQSLTFVRPLADVVSLSIDPQRSQWWTFALTAALGVIVGSLVYHLWCRKIRLEHFASVNDFARNVCGGLLLGLGGVLALGCTIGQGVTGVSTLALGSIVATVTMGLGAAIALKIETYRLMYGEVAGPFAIVGSALADLRLFPTRWRTLDKI